MSITTICPACEGRWHVQDSLLGKPLRCPAPTCRHVFTVKAAPSNTQPPTSPGPSRTGSVGDVIELLPVEPIEPIQPTSKPIRDNLELVPTEAVPPPELEFHSPIQAPTEKAWWEQAPPRRGEVSGQSAQPPVQKTADKKTHLQRKTEPAPTPSDHHREAPPVRRRPVEPAASSEVLPEVEPVPIEDPSREPQEYPDELPHRPHGRLARWIILPFVGFTILALGIGAVFLVAALRDNEDRLAARADQTYDDGQFRTAGDLYSQLVTNYPDSERFKRYSIRQQLCGLRDSLVDLPDDISELLDSFDAFLAEWSKDEQLVEHMDDYSKTLGKMLVDYSRRAATAPDNGNALVNIERGGKLVAKVRSLKLPRGSKPVDFGPVESAFAELRQAIARMKKRREILDQITALVAKPSYASLVQFEQILTLAKADFPDLPESPEMQKIKQELIDGHRRSVHLEKPDNRPRPRGREDDFEPALIVDPLIQGRPLPATNENGVVLALDRGVLYALDRASGQVRWALRVGIDITALPVRVPRRPGAPERILVLSSDNNQLTALDDSGRQVWRYPLRDPVLGRPVVVEQRAYLATYNGEVHEVELNQGRCLGRYVLGHRLTQGGTLEPGSSRVYFPADDGCVYVLNVAERRCEAVLYSRHPAGSLRGEAMILPSPGDNLPALLVLNQASGLDQVRLRVFELPIVDGQTRERQLKVPADLKGWTWFDSYHDPEKIVLLSDEAILGVFGIRQPGNRDQELFPLVPGGGLNLTPLLGGAKASRTSRQRAEVVQLQGNDLWVLAAGRLQRLTLVWNPAQGPQLIPAWREPVTCGLPIHASQHLATLTGTDLVTVTRPPERSCCWASRIDDETGKLVWRRQLGLVAHREPLPIKLAAGEPIWLVHDAAGTLIAVDPQQIRLPEEKTPWLSLPRNSFVAESLAENPQYPPLLLPSEDGKVAYALAFPTATEMILRTVRPAAEGRQLDATTARVDLPDPLAGAPVLVGEQLILALADGALGRVLPGQPGPPEIGPTWRRAQAAADARCLMVALNRTQFVSSDGSTGLHCWEWTPGNPSPDPLPLGRDEEPTVQLEGRIIGLIRLGNQLAAADSEGVVTLLAVLPGGGLEVRQRWKLPGAITAGPFACGERLTCVVGNSRLVLLDPNQDAPVWSYETKGLDALVGSPLVLPDRLVVVDQSGHYVALDLKTGAPLGDGYQLTGSMAPASSPVLFHPERLLAPLSDGTLLLLGMDRLSAKKKEPAAGEK